MAVETSVKYSTIIKRIIWSVIGGLVVGMFIGGSYESFAATTIVNADASADNSTNKGGVTATSTPEGGDESWNRGGQTSMSVGYANGANKIQRGLIKFDLSSIPTNAYVTSSTMRLYCNFKWPSNAENEINAYQLLRDWSEGTSADGTYIRNTDSTWWHTDYPEQWGTQGADLIGTDRTNVSLGSAIVTTNCQTGTGSTGVAGEHNWQLATSTIRGWVQDSSSNYGMILIGDEVTDSIIRQFATRETSTVAYQPRMMVQYDLIPDTPTSLGGSLGVADGSYLSTTTPNLPFTQADDDSADTLLYHIQIDDSSDFSSPVVDYLSSAVAQGATSFTVGQAAGGGIYIAGSADSTLSDGDYYWRVQSNDGTASSTRATANSGSIAFHVDTSPPVSATFDVSPTAGSPYAVSMSANASTDAGEGTVQYRFTETSGNPGGSSSGWQSATSFSDTGLQACTTYEYRVDTKDGAGNVLTGPRVEVKTHCLGGGAAAAGPIVFPMPMSSTDSVINEDVTIAEDMSDPTQQPNSATHSAEILSSQLIKYPDDPRVFLFYGDTKYWIATEAIFLKYRYHWTDIQVIQGEYFRSGYPLFE